MSKVPAMDSFEDEDLPAKAIPEELELWMEVKIYVGDDCPLTNIDDEIKKINLQQMRDTCRADIVTEGEELDVLHLEQQIKSKSPAWVFHEHGSVPHVTDADDESITVAVFFENRNEVPELVESLENTGYTVEMRRLVDVSGDLVDEPTALCNLAILTEKQHEAVRLAMERGYYDRCSSACMESMAEELGISKSALSRRLQSAEAKLMLEFIKRSEGV